MRFKSRTFLAYRPQHFINAWKSTCKWFIRNRRI